jgi:hypothetical protein
LREVFDGENLHSNVVNVFIVASGLVHHVFVVCNVANSQALFEAVTLEHAEEEFVNHLLCFRVKQFVGLEAKVDTGAGTKLLSIFMGLKCFFKLLFLFRFIFLKYFE